MLASTTSAERRVLEQWSSLHRLYGTIALRPRYDWLVHAGYGGYPAQGYPQQYGQQQYGQPPPGYGYGAPPPPGTSHLVLGHNYFAPIAPMGEKLSASLDHFKRVPFLAYKGYPGNPGYGGGGYGAPPVVVNQSNPNASRDSCLTACLAG